MTDWPPRDAEFGSTAEKTVGKLRDQELYGYPYDETEGDVEVLESQGPKHSHMFSKFGGGGRRQTRRPENQEEFQFRGV